MQSKKIISAPWFRSAAGLFAIGFATLFSAGCAAEVPNDEDAITAGEDELTISSNDVGVIAFDGTNNHYAQNTSMVKMFRDSPMPAGQVERYGFTGQTKTYYSYVRRDAQGGLRAIYYDGAPEGVLEAAFRDDWDSGASYILKDATSDGFDSPVCKLVNNPRIKKVYVVGYSRGAVTAATVAKRIGSTLCGSYQGAKLAWVGLIDPVATGMEYLYLNGTECERTDPQVFNHTSLNSACMAPPSYLNTLGKQSFIPVSLFAKNYRYNVSGGAIKLSTQGMPKAFVDSTFSIKSGAPQDAHIAMADDTTVLAKLKAAAKRRGGYGF